MTIRLALAAAAGKMGRAIVAALSEQPDLQLVAALGRPGAENLGEDIGRLAGVAELGVPLTAPIAEALAQADILVDFSPADAALCHLRAAAQAQVPVVLGSTGFSADQQKELQELSTRIPLVAAANMSVGINVLLALLPQVVATLGEDYDIEIIEAHHNQKRDAPSGTALALGRAAAAGRKVELDAVACWDRNGSDGLRGKGSIGFATLRAADVVGEHSVWLAGAGERLELTHRASSRRNFAEGALRAVRWLQGRPAGLYDMQDVLGLRRTPAVE
ncbi:4-hydroxy-tetrahydrodipicolinate reductase [Acidithiobacillus sp. CV18-2]|uniref:4-hydroxy-tetrahydrodipicolinate reductase n=1 Tax=Igneacidithiobacillus copahuensis TaxID=2724909 RepID=A0AAE2YPB5_9PROT|nr:4-hydroxy-tetrahydrodipicolinate reductase [Igneacidithiobacillus copahuensis]MBU2755826.1 4-hydroxy-tetrahydrodipicolinate reductase [Acidithiobacillus sp. CV18-3]MBU2756259.1 4-hydroxy-tetrahydrodipicolinate reductase [Acidithiobacillus sp. BN09-2]MBU2777766.1 4-hydroxy-tetrahydrodipicolinate reductase [Acidithiobacillus sp. CV18-2]MBU2795950.1 4-hydroxy-tetrahydrodipicolinate reductase [Acidithiobacillus sp. VAN18-2]MBU2800488.1 4-hydroxy-tetrahydrodipicolinate reductase [Acidithiobacill